MEPQKLSYREDEYHKDIRERLERVEEALAIGGLKPKLEEAREPQAKKRGPGRPPKVKENDVKR